MRIEEIEILGRIPSDEDDPEKEDREVDRTIQEFEDSLIGKAVLGAGYALADRDLDDDDGETVALMLSYQKEGKDGKD